MIPGKGHQTSLQSSDQSVESLSSTDTSSRSRAKRQMMPNLIITKDRKDVYSDMPNDVTTTASTSTPSYNTTMDAKSRTISEDRAQRQHRNVASSSGFDSAARRLSQSELLRYSALASEDVSPKKQLNPLKLRQRKKSMPFEHLPPTPVTAYFDASGMNNEDSDTASRSVHLSTSSTAPSNSSIESLWSRQKASIVDLQSPIFSSDGKSIDEMESSDSIGALSLSLSSEIDTPGPFTPATPAWRPRELTLLKKSSDSSNDSISRDRQLVGLGLQSPTPQTFPNEESNRLTKSSRLLAKDVLPINNFAQSKRTSPLVSNGPKELKLASSSGPPGSLRAKSQPRSSTSLSSTFSQHSKNLLPVLPSGPTFSSDRPASSSRRGSHDPNTTAYSSEQDFAILYRSLDDDSTRLNQSRNDSMSKSPSFSLRANSAAAGSRRKAPPAVLDLGPSSASAYHHIPAAKSDPTSARSSSLPARSFSDKINEGHLAVPRGNYGAEDPLSPLIPNVSQSFHTPMQSPITPGGMASLSVVLDNLQLQRQLGVNVQSGKVEAASGSGGATVTSYDDDKSTQVTSPLALSSVYDVDSGTEEAKPLSLPFSSNNLAFSDFNDGSLENQTSPHASRVKFNTDMFTKSVLEPEPERSLKNNGHLDVVEEKRRRDTISTNASPTSSPGPRHSAIWSSATSDQRPRSNSLHQSESRLPLAQPRNLPLPMLPTLLVKSPSNEGSQMQWEQDKDAAKSIIPKKNSVSIQGSRKSSLDSPIETNTNKNRALPPLPKPKLSLVPDVPSFGYTGPISSRSVESVEASSPLAMMVPFTDFHEEPAAASRWSSGSDSEDERPIAKSTYKRSFKQRKSSSSEASKKNSMSGGSGISALAATTNKKSGFFSGLGLRKKSTTNLSAQVSPMAMYTSSPASGKPDSLAEFPFPTNSPASYSRQSFSTTNSRRGSNVQMPPTGFTSTLPEGQSSGSFHSSQVKLVSSRTSESSNHKLSVKSSDASSETPASIHGSTSASTRFLPNFTSQSPDIEQGLPTDKDYYRGLGIQMSTQEDHLDDDVLRETYDSSQNTLPHSEEGEEKRTRSSWRKSKSHQIKEQGEKGKVQSKGLFGLRKQSFSGSVEQKKTWSKSQSGPSSPSIKLVSSPTESTFSNLTSSDETPRLPYVSLSGHHESHIQSNSKKEMASYESCDFEGLGQAIMQSPVQATLSTTTPALVSLEETNVRARRIRVEGASARPRYTSLTDVGRQWRDEHPDSAFGGAQGLDLLCNVLSGGQTSSGKVNEGDSGYTESDSGTDDYGSSEGNSAGQGSKDIPEGSHGNEGNQGDDDKRFNRKDFQASEENPGNSSSESEDSYGASDEEDMAPVPNLTRHRADSSSDSADDVPLGQQIQNPDQLQRQLRQMATKTRKGQDAPIVMAAKAEVSSNDLHFVLDANDLSARLVKVQLQREATEAHVGEGVSNTTEALSRNQSLAARNPTSYKQMMPNAQPLPALPKMPIAPIQTSNLVSASRLQGQSSPILPNFRQLQPMSSGTMKTDSSDVSMKTALEAQPSSSTSQREEDHRSAVIADFANTIKARSRSRSFGLQFPPPLENARPPPMPSRSVLVPQLNNVSTAPLVISKGERSHDYDDGSHSGSLIASPRHRDASTGFQTSSHFAEDDEDSVSRTRQMALPAHAMVQHLVYLINKQRCGTAEVEMNARVRDVVHSIMEREPMPPDSRTAGWVLYDVCEKLGIERPIREYELISEVIALRSNVQNDYFILKKTELAPYLSIKNVPSSSAALAGWIYVQDNHRKRWNKRWLELRDNCLYSAKTEKGKDEGLLCSLSSFDLYLTDSNRVKTPKQYSFALRSQNSINMFESPEIDYVHYFSLSDAGASRHWITAILNARTFVLRQEKSHIFRVTNNAAITTAPASANATSGGITNNEQTMRSNARQKAPLTDNTTGSSPSKLVNTTSPLLTFTQTPFPKGSLMEERFARGNIRNEQANGSNQPLLTDRDRKRREEVQLAERKGRKEGKPLLDIIPDVSSAARPNNGLGSINRL